jgi:Putative amidoligase enzyme
MAKKGKWELTVSYDTPQTKEQYLLAEKFRVLHGSLKHLAKSTTDSAKTYIEKSSSQLDNALSYIKVYNKVDAKPVTLILTWNLGYSNPSFTGKFSESFSKQDNYYSSYKSAKASIRQQIKEYRSNNKSPRVKNKQFQSRSNGDRVAYVMQGTDKVGYTRIEAGSILWMLYQRQGNQIGQSKQPTTKENHVGIELEFFCKVDDEVLSQRLFVAGVAKYVQVKSDGSIRTENERPIAHELCILAKETEYEDIVHKVCEVIRACDGKVNKSCGMHVHLDMRNRDREIVFTNLVSSQNVLYAMNPKSRLESINGTRYCAVTRGRKFNPNMNRYHGINAAAYPRHGTIEVRMHSGTIDNQKIVNWVKILLRIANRTTSITRSASTIRGFVRQFEVPIDLAEYVVERIIKFADTSSTSQEEAA